MTSLLSKSVAAVSALALVVVTGCTPQGKPDPGKAKESAWVALSSETIPPIGSRDQNNLLGIYLTGDTFLLQKGAPSYAPLLIRYGEGYVYPDGDGLVEIGPSLEVVRRHQIANASVLTFATPARHSSSEAVFLFNSPQGDKNAPNLITKVSPAGLRQVRTNEEISALAVCTSGEVAWLSTRPLSEKDVTGPGKVRLSIWKEGEPVKRGMAFDVERAPTMFSAISCNSESPHAIAMIGDGGDTDPHWKLINVDTGRIGPARRIPRQASHALTQAWSVHNGRSYLVTWRLIQGQIQNLAASEL